MEVSAWCNGATTYGIRVGVANRQLYFDPTWEVIEVEVGGVWHQFHLTPGFWADCPEFRDPDLGGAPAVRDWLQQQALLPWPPGQPPHFQLVPVPGAAGHFQLL